MTRSAACYVAAASTVALLAVRTLPAQGHVFLMQPISRNLYYSSAFQSWDFPDITYCPHCLQANGLVAVRERSGGEAWPHLAAYERGELAGNGNYFESDEMATRHGVCGDPEQGASENSNVFGRENSLYPVLETYQEGSIIEMKVVVSTYHWGHLEYFICDSEDLSDPEGGPVTQSCLNMHPLTRAEDDGDASPIDPNHPGRYYLDPPCRADETDQTTVATDVPGYVVTGRYQLPEGLTCERCIVQMVYYTGNSCRHPGYDTFQPESVPDGCVPSADEWVFLDPRICGEDDAYPEEFWNCADISITSDGSPPTDDDSDDGGEDDDEEPAPTPEPTLAPSPEPSHQMDTPSPITAAPPTPSPTLENGDDDGGSGDDDDNDCGDTLSAWQQCGGRNWTGSDCCQSGYECVSLSDDYAQCRPVPRDDDGCSYFWEQCGGIDWSGPTCCSSGSECVRLDDWYSQCVP